MAKGPKDRDGESTTDELTEIHRGVDQEAPREGIETPGEPIDRKPDDNAMVTQGVGTKGKHGSRSA